MYCTACNPGVGCNGVLYNAYNLLYLNGCSFGNRSCYAIRVYFAQKADTAHDFSALWSDSVKCPKNVYYRMHVDYVYIYANSLYYF